MSAAGALLRGSGRRKGWRSLAQGSYVTYKTAAAGPAEKDLTVGRVIRNEHVEQRVLVQPSRRVWAGTRIVHRPEYLTTEGTIMNEALDNRRREEIVKYAALVSQVELLTGGELMHGCSRRLKSKNKYDSFGSSPLGRLAWSTAPVRVSGPPPGRAPVSGSPPGRDSSADGGGRSRSDASGVRLAASGSRRAESRSDLTRC